MSRYHEIVPNAVLFDFMNNNERQTVFRFTCLLL